MSRMKNYVMEVSEALGLGGDLTDEVARIATMMMDHLTVRQAAEELGISRQAVLGAIKHKKLALVETVVIEKRLRKAAVAAYMARPGRHRSPVNDSTRPCGE